MKFAVLIELPTSKYQQKRLAQLDLLDEKMLQATKHIEIYLKRVTQQYAKSVIERKF